MKKLIIKCIKDGLPVNGKINHINNSTYEDEFKDRKIYK